MPSLVFTEDAPAVQQAPAIEWRERTVVFRRPAGNVLWMDGWQYGPLVVHATWDDPGAKPYVVAHLHTLLVLCRCQEVQQCVERAEWLVRECGAELSAREPDARRLPAGVVQWCRENQ